MGSCQFCLSDVKVVVQNQEEEFGGRLAKAQDFESHFFLLYRKHSVTFSGPRWVGKESCTLSESSAAKIGPEENLRAQQLTEN